MLHTIRYRKRTFSVSSNSTVQCVESKTILCYIVLKCRAVNVRFAEYA